MVYNRIVFKVITDKTKSFTDTVGIAVVIETKARDIIVYSLHKSFINFHDDKLMKTITDVLSDSKNALLNIRHENEYVSECARIKLFVFPDDTIYIDPSIEKIFNDRTGLVYEASQLL